MKNKIKRIMAIVFGINADMVCNNTSPESVESWDSLRHMNLVIAIEEEFDLEFDENEIAELLTYDQIVKLVKSKI